MFSVPPDFLALLSTSVIVSFSKLSEDDVCPVNSVGVLHCF